MCCSGMSIHDVAAFPFPTPPSSIAILSACRTLSLLGALSPEFVAATPTVSTSTSSAAAASASSEMVATVLSRSAFRITPIGSSFVFSPLFDCFLFFWFFVAFFGNVHISALSPFCVCDFIPQRLFFCHCVIFLLFAFRTFFRVD